MEALDELIKLLEDMNNKSWEISKSFPDKSQRPRFRHYCGAYTAAIIEAKRIREAHQSSGRH